MDMAKTAEKEAKKEVAETKKKGADEATDRQ